jgi:hypothetical protein
MDLQDVEGSQKLSLIIENRLDERVLLDISRPGLVGGLVEGLRPGRSLHDRITESFLDIQKDYPIHLEVTPRQAARLGRNAIRLQDLTSSESGSRLRRANPLISHFYRRNM